MFRIIAAVMLVFVTILIPPFAFISVPIFLIYISSAITRRCHLAAAYAELDRVEKELDRRKALKALS